MKLSQWATPTGAIVAGAALLLVAGAVVWMRYRDAGGVRQLAQDVASGTIDAAGGVAVGTVSGIGEALGLTRTDALIDDVERARELIGQFGFLRASRDTTARAFLAALREGPTYYGNEGRAR
jgi:hypothetical protein